MKKILKRIKEGLKAGLKKIPARIYILLLLSIVAIAIQVIIYQPFVEMADSNFQVFAEYEAKRGHKSTDEQRLEDLMNKDQQLRDKYLVVDLTAETNIFKKLETSIVSSFATVDSTVAQGIIFVSLSMPYLMIFKLLIVKPIASFFSEEERNKRKSLKQGRKQKLLEEKNSKRIEKSSTKGTRKKASRYA